MKSKKPKMGGLKKMEVCLTFNFWKYIGSLLNDFRGEKFEKMKYDPPSIKHKKYGGMTWTIISYQCQGLSLVKANVLCHSRCINSTTYHKSLCKGCTFFLNWIFKIGGSAYAWNASFPRKI